MAVCHLDRDKLETNLEANEREETGKVLKNALRREAGDTEEPSLSLCPRTQVLKLARTGRHVICAGAQAPLLQRGQMLY